VLSNPNIYGTSLIYDTVSEKLLPWEAWGKHVNLEIAEIDNLSKLDDAKSAEEIIGPWIAKLLALEWVPFGEELIVEPEEDEVGSAKDNADNLAYIQLRFVKFSLREIYIRLADGTTRPKSWVWRRESSMEISLTSKSKSGQDRRRRFSIKHIKSNGSGRE
jgi:hypothetical protein